MFSRDANEDGLKFLDFETAQETQIQEHQQTMTKRDETMFEDATDKIKKSKRNKTLVDPFGYTSHK